MKKCDPNYEKRMCPVCGKHELLLFGICDGCGWENDPLQHDSPDYRGGANEMSLNEARAAYKAGKPIN